MQVDGYRYKRQTLQIQCFPLYTLLLALGNPVVDILSLDIEGAELQVINKKNIVIVLIVQILDIYFIDTK